MIQPAQVCPAPWQPVLGVPRVPGEVYLLPSPIYIQLPLAAESRHGKSRGAGSSAGRQSDRELWATQSPHLFCISEFTAVNLQQRSPAMKLCSISTDLG